MEVSSEHLVRRFLLGACGYKATFYCISRLHVNEAERR
jgi:hypothetical protein